MALPPTEKCVYLVSPGEDNKDDISSMNVAFSLKGVSVAYEASEGIVLALEDIDLQVAQGEWIAVVGDNGSGKSTLASILAGFYPLSRGTLSFGLAEKEKHPIQIIFQNPDAQFVGETVYEDICFGLENTAIPPQEMRARAQQALDLVGLRVSLQQRVEYLSGGQKQLLCIASALAVQAEVFLFDESTSMLDPLSRQRVLAVVEKLHRQGKTILWVTQFMDELGYASRVLALKRGSVVFDGSPVQFFYGNEESASDPAPCTTLGFSLPYSVQVVHHLLRSGIHLTHYPVLPEQFKEMLRHLCP